MLGLTFVGVLRRRTFVGVLNPQHLLVCWGVDVGSERGCMEVTSVTIGASMLGLSEMNSEQSQSLSWMTSSKLTPGLRIVLG